jgi:hypothetical protein
VSDSLLLLLLHPTCSCPALFLAKDAVLATFSVAKQTSVVVDSGYFCTTGGSVTELHVCMFCPVSGTVLVHGQKLDCVRLAYAMHLPTISLICFHWCKTLCPTSQCNFVLLQLLSCTTATC